MSATHAISTEHLSLEKIHQIISEKQQIKLSAEAEQKINHCRTYLDNKIKESDTPIYGINTGFGSLYKKNISRDDLEQLQVNLMISHACGMGAEIPSEVVKLMLLLKIQSLSYGNSGVQLVTVQRLVEFFNHDVLPVVYEFGSLGASGDLAPLAHLCLPLIGRGEVYFKGKKISGEELNKQMGWESIHLKSKEGLALLNGTQFMSSLGVWNLLQARKLNQLADTIGAISLDAYDGRIDAFDALIHHARPHAGQIKTAENFRDLLKDSEIIRQPKKHVQDPYSFRCIPQVHGATKDACSYVEKVFLTEINGVTDNPNIFPDDDKILSGGNFHGQPLAITLDFLAIAMAELGNISERRTYQLISGLRELPDFLVANPGLNSGLMIPQYTAASIVSMNKQLCSPSSIDSIVSSNGQEDHVSMGANAAVKAMKIINNLYMILGIELITASQAIHFRRPMKTSTQLENILGKFVKQVPFIENDRLLHDDMVKAVEFLKAN